MSAANPTKGVAALLPRTIEVGGGYAVRPLSLGMYAILERIKSPMLVKGKSPDTLEMVPTLYVLTHDPMDSLSGNLFEKSVAWADGVDPKMLVRIRDAAIRQIAGMTDVIPEASPKKKRSQRLDRRIRPVRGRSLRLELRPDHVANAGVGRRSAPETEPPRPRRQLGLPAKLDRGA